jgi:hypothetical protein
MNDFLKVIISTLTGVIVGFILGVIRDRAKLVVSYETGSFYPYINTKDSEGVLIRKRETISPNHFDLSLSYLVYNKGRTNTAVKNTRIILKKGNQKRYYIPQIYRQGNIIQSAFNVPVGSVESLTAHLTLDKDVNTNLFFENIKFDYKDSDDLKFILQIIDIRDKTYEYVIEPISILVAAER